MSAGAATSGRVARAALLGATVAAGTVALGLVTGTGPLLGPMAAAHGVGTGAVSLALSATLCAALGLGVVTGPLAPRLGTRMLVGTGALLVPTGLFAAAAADRFAPAAAALVAGVGVGAGCVVVPMAAATGAAFAHGRGTALVVATAGGGLGTVVTPPVLAALLPVLGLPGTLRAAGLVSAGVLVACVPACPGRPRPTGRRTPAAGRPSAGPGWRLLAAATVGLTAAMFVPFTHLPGYAAAHGTDPAGGAALVALAGAASLTGRLLAVPAQARWGAWAVHRAGAAVFCGAFALWATAPGPTGLTAFAVVFGLGHGAYLGVAAAVVLQLHGTGALALRIGSLHAATAVGGLVGPAAAGVAADLTGSPSAVVAVGAALGVAGCAVLAAVRPTAVTGRPAGSAGAAQPPRCRSIA